MALLVMTPLVAPDTEQCVSVHACACVQALLGPSGAGKSTLMDILAMRKSTGTLAGSLLLDGQPATHAFIKLAAYVPQASHAYFMECESECVTATQGVMLSHQQLANWHAHSMLATCRTWLEPSRRLISVCIGQIWLDQITAYTHMSGCCIGLGCGCCKRVVAW
jgi:energy-coupling factor transporter ATP-binding protein EcfA2